jgi:hypothetical protein
LSARPAVRAAIALGVCLTPLWLGAGCKSRKAAPPSTASLAPVEVLDAGKTPRRELRLSLAPGVKQTLTMRAETSVVTPAGAQALPAMSVTILTTQAAGKTPTDTDVTFHFQDFKLSAPEGAIPAGALAKTQFILDQVKTVQAHYTMTDRGLPNGSHLDLEAAPPELKAIVQPLSVMLDTSTVVLPVEPVGVGARWRQRVPRALQGITLVDITTYELVEDAGQTLRINKTSVQSADPQPMALPNGTKGRLLSYSGTTSGAVTLNLTRSSPESLDMTATSSVAVQDPGAAQPVSVDMVMKASMGAVDTP